MSAAAALARVDELTQRLGLLGPPPPAASSAASSSGTFAAALTNASSPRETPSEGTPFWQEIVDAARREGLDPALVRAVVKHESGFDPKATSHAGAMGLMQLMPATARGLGVTDPYDPVQSLAGGTKYLRSMLDRFGGNVRLALAAYNAGPGAVERYGGVPPYEETQTYVRRVLDTYHESNERSTT